MDYLQSLMTGEQTNYDAELKALKDYFSGKGLMGSSFYQKAYDDRTKYHGDFTNTINSIGLNRHNDYINARDRGELPEQILQKQKFENDYKKLLASIKAGQEEQAARRLAAVQPSQILDGNLVGSSTQALTQSIAKILQGIL